MKKLKNNQISRLIIQSTTSKINQTKAPTASFSQKTYIIRNISQSTTNQSNFHRPKNLDLIANKTDITKNKLETKRKKQQRT